MALVVGREGVVARAHADGGEGGFGELEIEDDAVAARLGALGDGLGAFLDGFGGGGDGRAGDGDVADGGGDAVEEEFDLGVGGEFPRVLQADEDGEVFGGVVGALGSEPGDGEVGGVFRTRGVVDDGIALPREEVVEVGDASVGEEVEGLGGAGEGGLLGVAFGARTRIRIGRRFVGRARSGAVGLGELEGFLDRAGDVGLLDGLDGSFEAGLVGGEAFDDLGGGVEGDDHGFVGVIAEQVALVEGVDDIDRGLLGGVEAGHGGIARVSGPVARGHARGAVDHDDVAGGGRLLDGAFGLGDGEEGRGEGEEAGAAGGCCGGVSGKVRWPGGPGSPCARGGWWRSRRSGGGA